MHSSTQAQGVQQWAANSALHPCSSAAVQCSCCPGVVQLCTLPPAGALTQCALPAGRCCDGPSAVSCCHHRCRRCWCCCWGCAAHPGGGGCCGGGGAGGRPHGSCWCCWRRGRRLPVILEGLVSGVLQQAAMSWSHHSWRLVAGGGHLGMHSRHVPPTSACVLDGCGCSIQGGHAGSSTTGVHMACTSLHQTRAHKL